MKIRHTIHWLSEPSGEGFTHLSTLTSFIPTICMSSWSSYYNYQDWLLSLSPNTCKGFCFVYIYLFHLCLQCFHSELHLFLEILHLLTIPFVSAYLYFFLPLSPQMSWAPSTLVSDSSRLHFSFRLPHHSSIFFCSDWFCKISPMLRHVKSKKQVKCSFCSLWGCWGAPLHSKRHAN